MFHYRLPYSSYWSFLFSQFPQLDHVMLGIANVGVGTKLVIPVTLRNEKEGAEVRDYVSLKRAA